ncbi:MAG TPA: family 43 glycosylhydrolase, partial [Cellvibrio sp.]|nr:family 43 glycosylhydrolase [Cellvibrio sp.]
MKKMNFIAMSGFCLLAVNQSALAACIYKVTNDWGSGLTGEITVTNNSSSAVSGWNLGWQFNNNRLSSSWNATITGNNPYTASNLNWNGNLQPGQSATFGVQVDKNGGAAEVPRLTGSLCSTTSSVASSLAPISSSRSSSARSVTPSSVRSSNASSNALSVLSSASRSSVSNSAPSTNVSIVLEENQTGFCAVNGTIDNNNSGFTGAGFANSTNATGAGVDWSINVKTAGTYSFKWRYAASAGRSADLMVDGNTSLANISFPATGAWTSWLTSETVSVYLDAGVHKIRLQAAGNEGLSNIDNVTITGSNVTAANCETVTTPISFVNPSFTNIAVHDPSVIFANNQYYVFGSHLSVAKSPDLMRWSRVADGVNSNNRIFNNVTSELSEALTWAQTNTLWAPDVAYINGRYLMYYNACKGDSPVSALGIASSSTIEGPYTDNGLILRSGMWGQISEDGTVYNGQTHPNAVDPTVFYDNTNRLWMIYGSYSGGIFIMQLNASTGFPISGQGYGKHLMGGNHSVIEGAYVIFSPETNYYYMFVSFGGLDAAGGYNIRVSRSRNPNGPYLDAKGTDMRNVKANPNVPLFDTASLAPHGVKLVGNHVFAGTNNQLGYVSPGHNSAYRKAATGQYFLVFHTRFPGRGEQHEVRTHEFFFNADGWPVVSPLRYAEKVDANDQNRSRPALEFVAVNEIAGTYQLINHAKDISSTIKSSSNIQLANTGVITGAQSGNWV